MHGDSGGLGDDVDEAVLAVGEGEVVEPDVGGAEDADAVAVGLGAEAEVLRRVADHPALALQDVVDVDVVDDHVVGVLHRHLHAIGDPHMRSPPVDCLVAIDHHPLLEVDDHLLGKDDPQWLVLDHTPTERPGADSPRHRRCRPSLGRTSRPTLRWCLSRTLVRTAPAASCPSPSRCGTSSTGRSDKSPCMAPRTSSSSSSPASFSRSTPPICTQTLSYVLTN